MHYFSTERNLVLNIDRDALINNRNVFGKLMWPIFYRKCSVIITNYLYNHLFNKKYLISNYCILDNYLFKYYKYLNSKNIVYEKYLTASSATSFLNKDFNAYYHSVNLLKGKCKNYCPVIDGHSTNKDIADCLLNCIKLYLMMSVMTKQPCQNC